MASTYITSKQPDQGFGYYYRYYDTLQNTGYFSSDGDYFASPPVSLIELAEIPITKKTPKGVYIINPVSLEEIFIADHWRNKYAWPTTAEARAHFVLRKKRQHLIHEERSLRAREAYNKACDEWGYESEIKKAADLAKVYGREALKPLPDPDDDLLV